MQARDPRRSCNEPVAPADSQEQFHSRSQPSTWFSGFGRSVRERHQAELRRAVRQRVVTKDDLLSAHLPKTVLPIYHAWIDAQRHVVLPASDLKKDSVFYDIQCSPQDYLPRMLRMMRAVEAHGTSVKSVCPLRSSVGSKHVLTGDDVAHQPLLQEGAR
ncbi:hypothetical protein Gpo141_00005488 [Globisporangium polare]